MNRWCDSKYGLCALAVVLTVGLTVFSAGWSRARECTFTLEANVSQEHGEDKSWRSGCPAPGLGPRSVVVTVLHGPGGRLGNAAWEYLSTWAVARRYGAWPAVPSDVLQLLNSSAFTALQVPSLDELADRCYLPHLMIQYQDVQEDAGLVVNGAGVAEAAVLGYQRDTVTTVVLEEFAIEREIQYFWQEAGKQLRFKPELEERSQRRLRDVVDKDIIKRAKARGDWDLLNSTKVHGFHYVGVHVRRTDYHKYLIARYKAEPATAQFYLDAMTLLRMRLGMRAVFVVVSDDLAWCRAHLEGAPDVVIAGFGSASDPGSDLALLAACNHTVFAYGTFGLSAALHNVGGVTVTHRLKSRIPDYITAAMYFAVKLHWIIL